MVPHRSLSLIEMCIAGSAKVSSTSTVYEFTMQCLMEIDWYKCDAVASNFEQPRQQPRVRRGSNFERTGALLTLACANGAADEQ